MRESGTLTYYYDPPMIQASYRSEACGCRIDGNGTAPTPARNCVLRQACLCLRAVVGAGS